MKKLGLIALLLVGTLAVVAQEQVALKPQKSYRSTDTVVTFGVFYGDLDEHRKQLQAHMGKPKSENTGIMVWED